MSPSRQQRTGVRFRARLIQSGSVVGPVGAAAHGSCFVGAAVRPYATGLSRVPLLGTFDHRLDYGPLMREDEAVARLAAEAIAEETGVTIEQALDAAEFQDAAMDLVDRIEEVLGDRSGDVWFYYSASHCRLKVGVTTRVEPAQLETLRGFLSRSGITSRVDMVKVVWSTSELEAA